MLLAWINASKPKLEQMQREAYNECCITKILRWGVREVVRLRLYIYAKS